MEKEEEGENRVESDVSRNLWPLLNSGKREKKGLTYFKYVKIIRGSFLFTCNNLRPPTPASKGPSVRPSYRELEPQALEPASWTEMDKVRRKGVGPSGPSSPSLSCRQH